MLDDMLDYLADIRQRPVWQPITDSAANAFEHGLPREGGSLDQAYACFTEHVLPYSVGNAHPGFMGWVQGGGSVVGMLAEMLSAGLNANLGGREQMPIVVEKQVTAWMRELFGFPDTATGLFVTGSSIANLMAIWIARYRALGSVVRSAGIRGSSHDQDGHKLLTAYTSVDAHGCIDQALDLAGLGTDQLRRIPVDADHRLDLQALRAALEEDLHNDHQPFCIVGSSGTVDVGAIDDLYGLADMAQEYELWFHIDGACGALGKLSPTIAQQLSGIERADSIALDFHKWGQVPYDAGFLLVRDGKLHHDTFAAPAAYLRRETRGMAAGSPWPCDFGPDLSRSFKALKVWFTLQVYGANRLGQMMDHTCQLAQYLAQRVQGERELELVAPVTLNIVCFRYRSRRTNSTDTSTQHTHRIDSYPDSSPGSNPGSNSGSNSELDNQRHSAANLESDRLNAEIVVRVQESGLAAPSSTLVNGQVAIRAAIFNHRATKTEIDLLIDTVLSVGRTLSLQTGNHSK
ncbi:MAG: cytochrome D ubiquinol oxidase subunit I [Pirellulaceae bacterium]|nr:cytochrome D ubiquinol oxidase subunit I [Pirellulaceae bacterium]